MKTFNEYIFLLNIYVPFKYIPFKNICMYDCIIDIKIYYNK